MIKKDETVLELKAFKEKIKIVKNEHDSLSKEIFEFDREAGELCDSKMINYINMVSMFSFASGMLDTPGDLKDKTSVELYCSATSAKAKVNLHADKVGDFIHLYFK